jgi:hypothetical protein
MTNNVGSKFFNILQDMYDICQSAVKISNRHSEYFNVEMGVKQGDSLSLLYIIIILMIYMTFFMDDVTPYDVIVLIYLVLLLLMI